MDIWIFKPEITIVVFERFNVTCSCLVCPLLHLDLGHWHRIVKDHSLVHRRTNLYRTVRRKYSSGAYKITHSAFLL